jgi:Ca2+-binding RTX toxin-like protein
MSPVGGCVPRSEESKLSAESNRDRGVLIPTPGREARMKRIVLLTASMTLALLIVAEVALAQDGVRKICDTNCRGTAGNDRLIGTANPNIIRGLQGADLVQGKAGGDTLYGGPDGDAFYAANGQDKVYAGLSNDYVDGGSGEDYINAGPGDDTIAAKDGFEDQIYCGAGFDRIYVDRIDVLHDCEQKLAEKPRP